MFPVIIEYEDGTQERILKPEHLPKGQSFKIIDIDQVSLNMDQLKTKLKRVIEEVEKHNWERDNWNYARKEALEYAGKYIRNEDAKILIRRILEGPNI